MAEQCREQFGLDTVRFVPANHAPLKASGPRATKQQRLEMVRLAIAGHDAFVVDPIELERSGISYTVDTLAALNELFPDDELYLMMGSDSLGSFDQWREPARIVDLAIPLVVARPGATVDLTPLQKHASPQRWLQIQRAAVTNRLIDLSSSDIRNRVATGRSIRYMLPRAVEMYIQSNSIYRHENAQVH